MSLLLPAVKIHDDPVELRHVVELVGVCFELSLEARDLHREAHLAEVIASREEVEALLLRNALQHGDVDWEARIVAAYHALMRASEYRPNPGPYTVEWEGAHRTFHDAILSAARLPMLEDFHRSLWDHCARYRNLAYGGKPIETAVFDGHQQIMDAVLARDERGCRSTTCW